MIHFLNHLNKDGYVQLMERKLLTKQIKNISQLQRFQPFKQGRLGTINGKKIAHQSRK